MKRKFLILSVLAILVAILAANTLAYFTADTKAHNVITSGGVDIVLNEWANEDRTEPFEDRTGVMPGTKVTKIVEISNTGTAPVWVRAQVQLEVDGAPPSTSRSTSTKRTGRIWTGTTIITALSPPARRPSRSSPR